MSENESTNKPSGTRIIRSRFPKVAPNIVQSSGITRIRRLSGHYNAQSPSTNEQTPNLDQPGTQVPSTPPQHPPPSQSPLFANSPQHHLVETVLLSPRVAGNDLAMSPAPLTSDLARSPYTRQGSTFRQFVLSGSNANSPHPGPLSVYSHFSPGQPPRSIEPLYKPKFSKEHVMNIIKLKAIQKLKQNESDVRYFLGDFKVRGFKFNFCLIFRI